MSISRNKWLVATMDGQEMTLPRQVIARRSYMLTRRCTQRIFLLRPDKSMEQLFWYCFAVAAMRYGIKVVCVLVMSNHYHAVIEDPHGNYPEFLRYFHSLLGRSGNALRGRWENFWAAEQAGVLYLADPDALFREMIYTLTNPVKDHLVDKAFNWPGASSLAYQLADKPLTVTRPKKFFDPDGDMPDEVTLRFERPTGFEQLTHEEWTAKIRTAIEAVEKKAADERRNSGRKLLGRKAVRRQSPFSQPNKLAKRRGMVPRIATRNKWLRIERLQQNQEFQQAYRRAWLRRVKGDTGAVFPHGTYLLRIRNFVLCESVPASPG